MESILTSAIPILYTFRRCPYAIRARLAIAVSGVVVTHHEVALRNKPAAMLAISPKATVPVLQLADGTVRTAGTVIDESLNIMRWALRQNDPEHWLDVPADTAALIEQNDTSFKRDLDRYKYPNRFPETPVENYRAACEEFVNILNTRLTTSAFLVGDKFSFTDAAIVPFVRQFAHVDKDWFYQSPHVQLIKWLDAILASPLFNSVMKK